MSQRNQHKAMARGLRTVARERGIQLSHGECLDLVAQAAGLKNWNVLSAKLGMREDVGTTEQCSFCGIAPADGSLFWGPESAICRECVEESVEVAKHSDVMERLRSGEEGGAEAFLDRQSAEELARYVRIAGRRIAAKMVAIDQMTATLAGRTLEDVGPRPGVEAQRWAWLQHQPHSKISAMRDHQIGELALSRTARETAASILDRRRAG